MMKLDYFKATMLVTILFSGYCFYLTVWPFRTIEFYNNPFPITNENKEVCIGDTVRFRVIYKRYASTPVILIRDIYQKPEDSPTGMERDFTFPTLESSFPAGPHDVEISRDVVSAAAPTGKVTLRMNLKFPVNPLQTQKFYVETEPFTVKDCSGTGREATQKPPQTQSAPQSQASPSEAQGATAISQPKSQVKIEQQKEEDDVTPAQKGPVRSVLDAADSLGKTVESIRGSVIGK